LEQRIGGSRHAECTLAGRCEIDPNHEESVMPDKQAPLREGEYLAAKVTTLTLLAMLEGLVIVALGWGTDLDLAPVVLGSLVIGVLYTLFGFLVVFRYDSINEFLLPGASSFRSFSFLS
jgi:hypothetical protein